MLTVPLRSRFAAVVFLLGIIAAGLLLVQQTARLATAAEWTETEDIERLSAAARLDPGNPLIYDRLGFLYLREASDVSAALPHLRRATQLNPRVAVYWLDLANGCEMSGDLDCARTSYEKAVALAPMRPDFIWDLANCYLRTGDNERALAGFARYLHFVPEAREQAFALLNRGINDPELVWQRVVRVSGNMELELGYLAFLKRQNAKFATGPLWSDLVGQRQPLPVNAALPYVDRLLDNQEYDEAKRVWSDLQTSGSLSGKQEVGNLVFNGKFSEKPFNGGFDWHLHPEPFLEVDFTQSSSCKETHCLYLNFAVPHNADYEPLYQIVPVQPGRSYMLSAFVRSQAITSDSGPRLRVIDPECPDCLQAMTPPALETRSWRSVEVTFVAGPKTRAVKLSVWRPRSRVFPMEISGEFWLDSVSLKPEGATASSAP
jgi:tetratricopeptide (TPR) repeat protein